jgi:DNA-binding CsgD family transcriptional regulator
LGIGRGTVKTHLLRIFAKTGTRRQAELVKLAASLAPFV